MRFILFTSCLLLFFACTTKEKKSQSVETPVKVPTFNADSAYRFVEIQVAFGPRVPNTAAHEKAKQYFIQTLSCYGAKITEQNFDAVTFDDKKIKLTNLIASFQPEKPKRILIAAHWDTRPFADKDKEKKYAPMDGANDGASGVAVLLELARAMHNNLPSVGVDLLLLDGEDWGETDSARKPPEGLDTWWCLGSQYWAKNKHTKNYAAYFGILLDMVGAQNSQFYYEGTSMKYAPGVMQKVWDRAQALGYADAFVKEEQGNILDDHEFINFYGKIPTIDIVLYQPGIGYFGEYHHTQKDNLSIISKQTLGMVGSTVLHVVYHE